MAKHIALKQISMASLISRTPTPLPAIKLLLYFAFCYTKLLVLVMLLPIKVLILASAGIFGQQTRIERTATASLHNISLMILSDYCFLSLMLYSTILRISTISYRVDRCIFCKNRRNRSLEKHIAPKEVV